MKQKETSQGEKKRFPLSESNLGRSRYETAASLYAIAFVAQSLAGCSPSRQFTIQFAPEVGSTDAEFAKPAAAGSSGPLREKRGSLRRKRAAASNDGELWAPRSLGLPRRERGR